MIKRADQKKKLKEQTVSKIFQTNAQKFSHGFKIKVWHKFRNLLNSWSLHLLKTSYSPPPHLLLNQKKSLTNAILVQCLYNGLLQWFFFLIDWFSDWLMVVSRQESGRQQFQSFCYTRRSGTGSLLCQKILKINLTWS